MSNLIVARHYGFSGCKFVTSVLLFLLLALEAVLFWAKTIFRILLLWMTMTILMFVLKHFVKVAVCLLFIS